MKERLRPTLELESGSNDPMAYMLTILLIQVIEIGVIDWPHSIVLLFMQLSIGAAAGFALGYAIVWIINRINVPNESLYPVLLFFLCFFRIRFYQSFARERIFGCLYSRVSRWKSEVGAQA